MDQLTTKPSSIDPLTALIEEGAIRKVESLFTIFTDAKEFGRYSEIFTEDFVAEMGDDGLVTTKGVKTFIDTFSQVLEPIRSMHAITSQVVNLESTSQATAVSHVVIVQFGAGDGAVYAYPRYEDTLVKEETWKIKHRKWTYLAPITGDLSIFSHVGSDVRGANRQND